MEDDDGVKPIVMGIHMKVLNAILKKVKKNEKICMSSKNGSELTLSITDNESSHMTSYNIKLMDLESETLNIPDLENDFVCQLSPGMLKTWNSLIVDITKSEVDFTPMDNDVLVLKSNGDCQTVVRQEKIKFDVFKNPKRFTLNQQSIKLICSMSVFDSEIAMSYKSNMPIQFSTNLEGVQLECFFAPALSDDDMDED